MSKPPLVVIHPLVLLSVVDHYHRVTDKTQIKRVVGALLGEKKPDGIIDITNCYAIPFEEDPKDDNIWYLDHIYNETLYEMYAKININEKLVGWYTTGNRFKKNDIQINQIFYKYTPNPIFVVIDVHQFDPLALPTEAYQAQDEISKSGEVIQTFVHIPSTVQAFEPEEIGVEQLLREINNTDHHSLTALSYQKLDAVKGMSRKIQQIQNYLKMVEEKKITKANQHIMNNLQVIIIIQFFLTKKEILNYLPNLVSDQVTHAFTSKNNDNMFSIYVASLVRSTIAHHNLINNIIYNKEQEKQLQQDKKKEALPKDKKDEKQAEKKDPPQKQ